MWLFDFWLVYKFWNNTNLPKKGQNRQGNLSFKMLCDKRVYQLKNNLCYLMSFPTMLQWNTNCVRSAPSTVGSINSLGMATTPCLQKKNEKRHVVIKETIKQKYLVITQYHLSRYTVYILPKRVYEGPVHDLPPHFQFVGIVLLSKKFKKVVKSTQLITKRLFTSFNWSCGCIVVMLNIHCPFCIRRYSLGFFMSPGQLTHSCKDGEKMNKSPACWPEAEVFLNCTATCVWASSPSLVYTTRSR